LIIIKSINKIPVRLTNERWLHIIRRHPEMEHQKEKVLETLESPQLVLEGDFNCLQAIRFYSVTPLAKKYLVVIYKEIPDNDGFILTAYFTNKPSEKRSVVWKQ